MQSSSSELGHADFFGSHRRAEESSVLPDLNPGMRIARKYELVRKVGAGAMGEVWAARHLSLGEEVAIKLVRSRAIHGDGSSTDERFLLEARVAAQLSRKTRHIVSVTDHGEDDGIAYLVMELLNGESLEMRLARSGPLPLAKVVPLVYQIARALAVAHADGIVHRDLKPSNVFVTTDEYGRALIKILDFGIAKHRPSIQRIPVAPVLRGFGVVAKNATLRGVLLGTPAFMSPEQARGKLLDHRADVWALAVIAYNLLTNEVPFEADTPEEQIELVSDVAPIPIAHFRPDLPHDVFDLFEKAFAESIDDRFPTAPSFARALERIDSRERRHEGGFPAPMSRISLPPTAPTDLPAPTSTRLDQPDREEIRIVTPPSYPTLGSLELVPRDAAAGGGAWASGDSSILAAGVPRRSRRRWPLVLATLACLGVLLGTASVLGLYFERDPVGTALVAPPTQPIPPDREERNAIPPPPVVAPGPDPEPVLVSHPRAFFPLPVRESRVPTALLSPAAIVPSEATTTASLPPAEPPPRSARTIDRSEVF